MNYRGRDLAETIDLADAPRADAVLADNRWPALTAAALAAALAAGGLAGKFHGRVARDLQPVLASQDEDLIRCELGGHTVDNSEFVRDRAARPAHGIGGGCGRPPRRATRWSS